MRKILGVILIITCSTMTGAANSEIIRRHILALYNSDLGQSTTDNPIHENAEVILNHLGCIVDYWDIKTGLPNENRMQKYLGVLSWFDENYTEHPENYFGWACEQIAAKRKFIILGNIGDYYFNEGSRKTVNVNFVRFCRLLGLEFYGDWSNDVLEIELAFKDPDMVEFERSLDFELNHYVKIKSTNPQNKRYLTLKRKGIPDSESDLVFTTPTGALAYSPYIFYQNPVTFKKKWRINPFKFFEESLGLKGIPRPDVTTLNGLRIWCSHVDGDALISKSAVKPDAYCGEIIRDEIFKKYQWPVSVSVIVGEVETGEQFLDIARSIFRLPYIEAASHSYSHPFYWADDYRKKDEYASRHLPIKGYVFNLEKEIIGSIDYINNKLLPSGKKVKQLFWTGNCEPTPECIRLCEKIHVHNINGGDTVFDNNVPSYTGVTPLGADIGGYRQIYSPNSNENIYTNQWSGPYYGYRFVLDTFKNTESPVRIKPINVYYHFYIGEKWAALNSIKKVMDETVVQDVAPMFISEYIEIVHGFFNTNIDRISDNVWRIRDYGACTTIRFDETRAYPDLSTSSGLLGFRHYQNSLYVHLKEGAEAKIVLSDRKPAEPFLECGSHRVQNWSASKQRILFKTKGFGKGRFVIADLLANTKYQLSMRKTNRKGLPEKRTVQSGRSGSLDFLLPMQGPVTIAIDIIQ
ncbi:MAG: hypothetical protein ACE5IR_06595 [bacterium]